MPSPLNPERSYRERLSALNNNFTHSPLLSRYHFWYQGARHVATAFSSDRSHCHMQKLYKRMLATFAFIIIVISSTIVSQLMAKQGKKALFSVMTSQYSWWCQVQPVKSCLAKINYCASRNIKIRLGETSSSQMQAPSVHFLHHSA